MNIKTQLFASELGEIRTILDNTTNEVWFDGTAVFKKLGYPRSKWDLMEGIPEDDKRLFQRSDFIAPGSHVGKDPKSRELMREILGNKHKKWFLNEHGICTLILKSDKPEAKKLFDWIIRKVIPAVHAIDKGVPKGFEQAVEDLLKFPHIPATLQAGIVDKMRNLLDAAQVDENQWSEGKAHQVLTDLDEVTEILYGLSKAFFKLKKKHEDRLGYTAFREGRFRMDETSPSYEITRSTQLKHDLYAIADWLRASKQTNFLAFHTQLERLKDWRAELERIPQEYHKSLIQSLERGVDFGVKGSIEYMDEVEFMPGAEHIDNLEIPIMEQDKIALGRVEKLTAITGKGAALQVGQKKSAAKLVDKQEITEDELDEEDRLLDLDW